MVNRDKLLEMLERLEIDTNETEKEAKTDVDKCIPSKLFNFIAMSSSYRMMAGFAEEEYPEDPEIKEHVKSSKNLLIEKALGLASKFEKDCLCIPRERVGSELKKVLVKYKYPV